MPFYNDLRPASDFEERDFEQVFPEMTEREKLRCIAGLIRLRGLLAEEVRPRRTEQNLLIASWNIANLGDAGRLPEALYYIAEILAAFDLIAVQELTANLSDLDKIMRILGPNWRYIYNDPARGPGSNDESSAYLYNTDRVRPTGLTGELSVWSDEMSDAIAHGGDAELQTLTRFAAQRPPYITGFTTRWKRFSLVNLHLQPGKDSDEAEIRRKEIALLLQALDDNADQRWAENTILMGDMNFYAARDGENIEMLHQAGYWESDGLLNKQTNLATGRRAEAYDRMFFSVGEYFRIAKQVQADGSTVEQGGVVPIYDAVMGPDHWQHYHQEVIDKRDTAALQQKMRDDLDAAEEYFMRHYRWRQLSDHLPIWVELETDDTRAFLERNAEELTS
ncbi:MAG: endonuclease/exonuclease/phosphatase family protein [Pseudomonadota bacterium]